MTISPISLGNNFTNGSGTTVLGGLSSNLNTQSVINSIVAAQSAQVTTLNDQVSVNNKQLTQVTTLQNLLTQLQTAAAPLSNPQSADTTNNLFAVTTSNVTSNTTQAASNYLTATVASGTPAATYVISDISSVATNTTQETSAFNIASPAVSVVAATNTAGQFTAGTLTFTDGATVTLNANDSLTTVAQDFNNVTSTTGISASVLKTAAGQYKLIFTSTATGSAANFDLSNTTANPSTGLYTIASGQSVFGGMGGVTISTDQAGTDAQFKFNGVSVDRSTNTISDLVTGVTLNLLQNTNTQPNASFTLSIAPDLNSIEVGINNFATAYNNFLYFYSQQTELNSSGTASSSSVLYSDTTLRTIFNELSGEASSVVQGIIGSNPARLSDIGLTFTDAPATSTTPATANIISVDNTALNSALLSNFSGVENALGYNLTSSSPDLALFQSSNLQTISSFTVNIDATNQTYTANYTDTSGNPQTVAFTSSPLSTGGVALTAPVNSTLSGLQLIYVGSGSETITVNTTQGILAQVNSALTGALQTTSGLIATDQTAIQAKNTTLQTQITNVTTQVANTRQQLLQKYAALETAISSANSALNLLNAQQVANSASGG